MSTRHHSSVAHTVNALIRDVNEIIRTSQGQNDSDDDMYPELYDIYGIEIRADGTVYDCTDQTYYANIAEWAEAQAELDEDDDLYSHRSRFEDD